MKFLFSIKPPKKTLVVLVLFALLFAFRELLLTEYAEFFKIDTARKGADGILVLAGGNATRYPHALKLYQQGYSKRLF